MSTETERRELIRPDATVAYWTSGPERAPVVVLLHGATLDHHAWAPQAAALTGRYRVVLPDLRGHGESEMADEFRFGDVVADIEALLDEVATDAPLAIGGLSLGGNIAQEIVYRRPGKVDALVVADATCNTAPRHPLAAPLTVAVLSTMALTSRGRFLQRAATVTSAHEDVRRYVLDANAERSPQEVLQILTSLLDHALRPDPDYRLPVPTLLLHGAQDRVGDIVSGTRAWAGRDPMAEYVVVPDAGHASNLDNPAAFTDALAAFLDRVLEDRDDLHEAQAGALPAPRDDAPVDRPAHESSRRPADGPAVGPADRRAEGATEGPAAGPPDPPTGDGPRLPRPAERAADGQPWSRRLSEVVRAIGRWLRTTAAGRDRGPGF